MTLRAQMQADVAAVLLNADEHAETVTYRPKQGTARSITAIVDEDASFDAAQGDARRVDMARVFVSRSNTTGIDDPQIGDKLEVTRDNVLLEFAWTGEYGDGDAFGWHLVFRRTRVERLGSNTGR